MKRVSDITGLAESKGIDLATDPVYNNKLIQEFINHKKIDDNAFRRHYKTFYDFYVIKNNPEIFNIQPFLVYNNNNVEIKYEETEKEKLLRESRKLNNVVKTAYISKSILSASFKNLYTSSSAKVSLAQELINRADSYLENKETKGVYVYGKSGIGKSFMMGALYNYLKDRGKEPAIIFFPEFIRKVKSQIKDGSYNDIIDQIREQEILIIDDLGSENITDFVRDEVLVPIINYRSDENLLTFFTSNLGKLELSSFLEHTRDSSDKTKAARILRRIFDLTSEVYLKI